MAFKRSPVQIRYPPPKALIGVPGVSFDVCWRTGNRRLGLDVGPGFRPY